MVKTENLFKKRQFSSRSFGKIMLDSQFHF